MRTGGLESYRGVSGMPPVSRLGRSPEVPGLAAGQTCGPSKGGFGTGKRDEPRGQVSTAGSAVVASQGWTEDLRRDSGRFD